MALPPLTKTWVIQANKRLTAGSIAGMTGALLFAWKEFLKTNGYTIKGTSDGVTGGMDGVDRWTDSSKASIRGSNTSTPQSWAVITNGEGVDYMVAFGTGADYAIRMSASYGGNFVAAGTPTFTPTASDESVIGTQLNVVDISSFADHVAHFWTSTDRKDFRVVVIYERALSGSVWGIMAVESTVDASVTWSKPSVAFCYTATQVGNTTAGLWGSPSNGSRMMVTKVTPVATPILAQASMAHECFTANLSTFSGVFCELQNDYMVQKISVASSTANAQGKFGWLIDAWKTDRLSGWGGYTIGKKQFYAVGHWMWPWDGVTDPLTR